MSADLDPYRDWLGVRTPQRPLNYYQLLDLKLYEGDRQRIETAEMIQMAKVLRHESGPHAQLAAGVARELEEAVRCLLDPVSKAAYDAELFMAPHAPQQVTGDFELSPAVANAPAEVAEYVGSMASVESSPGSEYSAGEPPRDEYIDEGGAVAEEESAATTGYNFSDDLKLDDDEVEEELANELAYEPPSPPAAKPASPAAAASAAGSTRETGAAEQHDEDDSVHRPSLLDMLEQPATTKAKGKPAKERASEAKAPEKKPAEAKTHEKAAEPLVDVPRKSLLPSAEISPVKAAAVLALAAAIAVAVWLGPGLLQRAPTVDDAKAMLASPDPQTRIKGIGTLLTVEIDSVEAATLLMNTLKNDSSQEVRLAATQALVNAGVDSRMASSELKPMLATESNPNIKAILEWLVTEAGGR